MFNKLTNHILQLLILYFPYSTNMLIILLRVSGIVIRVKEDILFEDEVKVVQESVHYGYLF